MTEDFYCDEVLSGRTPVKVVRETAEVLAYHHTRPFWPVHIVVIPKRHVPSLLELPQDGGELLRQLFEVVIEVAAEVRRQHGAARVLTNLGAYQDSKHLHFHVNFGAPLRGLKGMHVLDETALRAALAQFPLEGELEDVRPLRRGHIHDTFVSRWRAGSAQRPFIHQRMNEAVFPDLGLLMGNIRRVSAHLVDKLRREGSEGFEPLELVAARDGAPFARTESGAWRTFVYIEDSQSFDRCSGVDQAWEAARAFGWFQAQLRDLPPDELGETLPRFFSTPHRLQQFRTALAAASDERRRSAEHEIAFALERAPMADRIETRLRTGALPRRVVHGDTKLNNILFDSSSGKAKGIVDLDTCMAGYSLYDFGDLVRFTAATSAEDETDLERVGTDLGLYHALADGYLSMARRFLTAEEIELMPFAARLVTYTIGLRFLADHLAGDVYFKIERAGHNLDRARVQLGMVRFMERHEAVMSVG